MSSRILTGDCREMLATLPAESVQMVCTSPPYYGLRSYEIGAENGEIGMEQSPDAYVSALVEVFRGVKRVLHETGITFLNLGDSYARGGMGRGSGKQLTNVGANMPSKVAPDGYKPKDLLGIPWRVALALQADGWWLRSAIVWAKPNPMPESVTDRPTSSYEMVFLLAKAERYFYDAEAIREDAASWNSAKGFNAVGQAERNREGRIGARDDKEQTGRNCRNVWTIATAPTPFAHFATMPPELAERCILAGTSEKGCCAKCGAPWARVVERGEAQRIGGATGCLKPDKASGPMDRGGSGQWDHGHLVTVRDSTTTGWAPSCDCNAGVVPCVVLDPFAGAGTTLLVADRLQRDAVGIELSPTYAAMGRSRVIADCPLFAEVAH